MASAAPFVTRRRPLPIRLAPSLAVFGGVLTLAIALAFGRQLARGAIAWPTAQGFWLTLHLVSVVPALPLGAYVLLARKGTPGHRLLGRLWAVLMLAGAASSFGLTGLMGHLGPIHLLSAITLVAVPWGVWCAVRGDVARHRRTMVKVYIGLLAAGLFAFVPGRLLGVWLFG